MSRITVALLIASLSLLTACATGTQRVAPDASVNSGLAEPEVSTDDRIYYFQHRLLPEWTYGTDGQFIADLRAGRTDRLYSAAAEIVSGQFASQMDVLPSEDPPGALLTFSEPGRMPNCYFVFISDSPAGLRYWTFERTFSLGDTPPGGVLGSWSADGNHANHGARDYKDALSFLAEFRTKR